MAVLVQKKITPIKPGGWYETYPVYRSTTLYEGGMVMLNATGYAIAGADTTGCTFAGVAQQTVVNSGDDGDKSITVYFGPFKVGSDETESQATVHTLRFLIDGGDVAATGTTSNTVLVGLITEFVDSATVWVDPRRRLA